MSRVVLLEHDGVTCALPAGQVAGATSPTAEPRPAKPLALFRRTGAELRGTRMVRVRTAIGERELPCANAHFDALAEEQMHPLPLLLRDALDLPHVVGVAQQGDEKLVWLIDLSRLPPSHEKAP